MIPNVFSSLVRLSRPLVLTPLLLAPALSGVLLTTPSAVEAQTREAINVRGGMHDGYGRMVFDWGREVQYRAGLVDGQLRVEFDQPAAFELASVNRHLSHYLGAAATDPYGYRLTFPLRQAVEIRSWQAEGRVVVDLHDAEGAEQTGGAARPATPAEQPAGAQGPAVGLRAGQHAGFGRLVFDWEQPVSYQVERNGANLVVSFDAPATFDLADYTRRPLPQVETLASQPNDEGARVALRIDPTSEVKDFLSGTRVVIDISDPTGEAAVAETRSQPAESETAQASDGAAPQVLTPSVPAPAPSTPTPAALPETASSSAPDSSNALGAEEEQRLAEMPVNGTSDDEGLLALDWAIGGGAAFRRGGWLWLVFEGQAPGDLRQTLSEWAGVDGAVEVAAQDGVAVARLQAGLQDAVRLSRPEDAWILERVRRPALPRRPLGVEPDPAEGRIHIPAPQAGPVISLVDPASGMPLYLALTSEPGTGVDIERRYQEFTLLPSYQGVIVQAGTDDLRVMAGRMGVTISRRSEPLSLSSRDTGDAASLLAEGRGLLALEDWARGRGTAAEAVAGEGYPELRRALLTALAEAPENRKPQARLDLARFYLAHAMAAEALGMLRVYAEEEPRRSEDPQILLMTAVAQLLNGDVDGAGRALGHPALESEPEALLWQADYAVRQGDWQAASDAFDLTGALIEGYSPEIARRLRLAEAEAKLGIEDAAGLEEALRAAAALRLSPAQRGRFDYMEARRQFLLGEDERGEELLRRVAAGEGPRARAQARLALLERESADGRIDRPEAIAELERLRFAWRGDSLEAELLARLADLYQEEHRYRDALDALRQTAQHYAGTDHAEAATQEMRTLFERLYLDGKAERMPALRALALYEAFRELTPGGEKGDRMAVNLAERLISVDLLDQGAELLDQQLRHRASGPSKVAIGTRLAEVRMLDRDPRRALTALQESRPEDQDVSLPQADLDHRNRLEARALNGLGRSDEALALLVPDTGVEARRLMAQILSEQGRWSQAADVLAELLPVPRTADTLPELDDESARRVLDLAIALTMADERAQLAQLEAHYGPSMNEAGHGDLLKLFTRGAGTDLRSVAGTLRDVGAAEAFLESYQRRAQAAATGG